jgi:outer membrane protein assembly factor BamB
MSDFISGLRVDLVEAAAREAALGRARRRRLTLPALRPAVAFAGAVVVAVAVAVGVAVDRLAPAPMPAAPKVVARLHLGGQPQDAVAAGGSLWVADFRNRLVAVDVADNRLSGVIKLPDGPTAIAAANGRIWALIADTGAGHHEFDVRGFDARTGHAAGAFTGSRLAASLAVRAGTIWVGLNQTGNHLLGFDSRTGRRIHSVRGPAEAVSIGGGVVWSLDGQTLRAVDEHTGRLLGRVPHAFGETNFASTHLLAADDRGVWVADQAHDEVARVEGFTVRRRLAVGAGPSQVVLAGDKLWVVVGDVLHGPLQLRRVDPESGRVTGSLDLGTLVPKAVVPVDGGVFVVGGVGTVLRVSG